MTTLNKTFLINEVKQFAKANKKDKLTIGTNNACFAASTFYLINSILNKNFDIFTTPVVVYTRDLCVFDHNKAINNATKLGKILIEKGVNEQDRFFAVKKYLKKDGNLIFTTLFRLTEKNKIKDIANGKEIEHYSYGCLFPKYWRKMFTKKDRKHLSISAKNIAA